MSYIYEQSGWPQFIWDGAPISLILSEVHQHQGKLLARMEGLGFDLQQEASLRVLTQDVVKSSAIEGEILDPVSVRSSIGRRLGIASAGAGPESRSIDGVVDMLLNATQKCAEPLTKERLCGWQAALFPTGYSQGMKITTGDWRPAEKDPMQVVSGPFGRQTVHFEAPGGAQVPAEMEGFLRWMNSSQDLDPVIRAAVAHLHFVTIHPFEDGNGRIARALSDMALAMGEKGAPRFYSLSAQIEAERSEYYDMLERTQKGFLDITPWLTWFITCCERALAKADAELTSVLQKSKVWQFINSQPVNERQKKMVNMLLDGLEGKLSSSKYARITKTSDDTALRDIKELMARGILEAYPGGGRSTRYRLAELSKLATVTGPASPAAESITKTPE